MGVIKVTCSSAETISIRRKDVKDLIILERDETASFSEHDFIVRSAHRLDKDALKKHRDKFLSEHGDKKEGSEYILY